MKKISFTVFFLLIPIVAFSQADSIWTEKPSFTVSGFADLFYVYDFNQPKSVKRQSFLFNHNRHNDVNLNLGFVKLNVEQTKYRANLAFHTGTYAKDNYTAEPGFFKSLFEANFGISLNSKNTLWLDVGVFPSHIGFESAISTDNWTMTRSLLAENSPYYLTGAKLSFAPTDKWKITGLVVNGWQRIQMLQGNTLPSFGTQIVFNPNKKIALNWSTFVGTDDSNATRRMRYFNNFYGQFQLTERVGLITGFDIGAQQKTRKSSSYEVWFSPVIIGQLNINKSLKTAIRAEFYQDTAGIIIPLVSEKGFKTTGLSLNFDYSPSQNIICRLEGRWLNSRNRIFETSTGLSNNNFIIGTSIVFKFSEIIMK